MSIKDYKNNQNVLDKHKWRCYYVPSKHKTEVRKVKLNVAGIELMMAEKMLTVKDIAENCGMLRQNVCSVLRRGKCEPRTAGKLARGLGVPVNDIILDTDAAAQKGA